MLKAMPGKRRSATASVEAEVAEGGALEEAPASVEEEESSRPKGKRPRLDRLASVLDKGFRPVSVVDIVAVQGGFLKQPEIVPVVTIEKDGVVERYVQLIRDSDWLCRAVSGEGRGNHPLKRVGLLDTLRDQIRIATGRAAGPAAAEAVDPAAQLEFSDEEPAEEVKPKRQKKSLGSSVATVVAVPMPARCAEAYPEEAESHVRQVRVRVPAGKAWRNIWLHSDDLPWALGYMHAQHKLQGVPQLKQPRVAPVGGGAVGSSSVEEKPTSPTQITWAFRESSWEATAMSPLGPRKRVLHPESLQLWEAQLVDERVQQLEALERGRLKTLAYSVLEKWGAAMTQGRDWGPQAA